MTSRNSLESPACQPALICQARAYPINFHRSLTRTYRTRRSTAAVHIDQSPVTRRIQLIFTRAAGMSQVPLNKRRNYTLQIEMKNTTGKRQGELAALRARKFNLSLQKKRLTRTGPGGITLKRISAPRCKKKFHRALYILLASICCFQNSFLLSSFILRVSFRMPKLFFAVKQKCFAANDKPYGETKTLSKFTVSRKLAENRELASNTTGLFIAIYRPTESL